MVVTSSDLERVEETLAQRLLVDGEAPGVVLRGLLRERADLDPLTLGFLMTTVASDLHGWPGPEYRRLAGEAFEAAALLMCESWALGFDLSGAPGAARAALLELWAETEPAQQASTTTDPTE
ncbi:hypothetical protein P73_0927 [Celeribacter indicus]|uniref:Uncharacterized protein n=1 Tax=Celeribacter indicus TaxID=1208324 RepID=A0A0B5DZN3_9RHOB|nr:hypothetical protein P73_0927 [Celeribacter indicus]